MNFQPTVYKIILAFTCLVTSENLTAQSIAFNWAKSCGGNSAEQMEELILDVNKNVYTVGQFQGNVDFDPNAGSTFLKSKSSLYDVFVQKLDSNGALLWAKSFGGSSDDFGRSVTVDLQSNVYITGGFNGTVDFNPGSGVFNLTSSGGIDIFIVKLNAQGDFQWAKKIGGNQTDQGRSLIVDNHGYLYVTGSFKSTVDFDPGTATHSITSAGQEDVFILKLDTQGVFSWAKTFRGLSSGYSRDIHVDDSNKLYVVGDFQGSFDFDPGSASYNRTSRGNTDYFIQKMDSSGKFLWAHTFGGSQWDVGYSVTTDVNNNVIIGGDYYGTVDFDPTSAITNLRSNGSSDVFIQKLNSSGGLIWAKSIGGSQDDDCARIHSDRKKNIYISGIFAGIADFDPSSSTYNVVSNGREDVFLARLDSSGAFHNVQSYGSADKDRNFGLAVDSNASVYLGGHYKSTCDFDPTGGVFNFRSNGDYDISIVKLSPFCVPITRYIKTTVCDSFIWKGLTILSSDTLIDTLSRKAGCDSIIILDLTVNQTSFGVDSINACGSFIWNGKSYTSSNFSDRDTTKAKNGCDSITTLNLRINYASFGFDSIMSCDEYTWNGKVYRSSNYSASDTMTNAVGCDSVVTLHLTILKSDSVTLNQTACDSFKWNLSGRSYYTSGIFIDTLKNSVGCDSLVTLDLVINNSSQSLSNINACNSYTWIDNRTYFRDTSNVKYVIQNSVGCDSMLVLNLTIDQISDSITVKGNVITSFQQGATYQWLDCNSNFSRILQETNKSFTVASNGSYSVEVTTPNCVDTSKCVDFTAVNSGHSRLNNSVLFFPNPIGKGAKLNITNHEQHVILFDVYDIQGLRVQSGYVESGAILETDFIHDPGVYIMGVSIGGKVYKSRLIKQ